MRTGKPSQRQIGIQRPCEHTYRFASLAGTRNPDLGSFHDILERMVQQQLHDHEA